MTLIETFTSHDYLLGVASTVTVMIGARLLKLLTRRPRRVLRRATRATARSIEAHRRSMAAVAAANDATLAVHVLDELRARLRSQTWVSFSFFLFAAGAFTLYLYIEVDSGLRVPAAVLIVQLALMLGAMALFAFSISDEKIASIHSSIVREALEERQRVQREDAPVNPRPADESDW